MGTPGFPYPHRYAQPLGALRLHLVPVFGPRDLAGLWVPYSRDLTREAAHLIDDFPRKRGRVDRLVYAEGDWDVVADEIFTGGGRIKVGFMPAGKADGSILIRLMGEGVLQLQVMWLDPRPAPVY